MRKSERELDKPLLSMVYMEICSGNVSMFGFDSGTFKYIYMYISTVIVFGSYKDSSI